MGARRKHRNACQLIKNTQHVERRDIDRLEVLLGCRCIRMREQRLNDLDCVDPRSATIERIKFVPNSRGKGGAGLVRSSGYVRPPGGSGECTVVGFSPYRAALCVEEQCRGHAVTIRSGTKDALDLDISGRCLYQRLRHMHLDRLASLCSDPDQFLGAGS